MQTREGTTFRVKSRGFLYWEGIAIIVAAGSIFGFFFLAHGLGLSRTSGWIWGYLALTAFWSSLVLFAKSTYPGRITIYDDRVELHSIFGRRVVRIDHIRGPTAVEGSYVWFGTSQDDGTQWTVMRVNGPVARLILASPHHPTYPVPPDLARKIAALDS